MKQPSLKIMLVTILIIITITTQPILIAEATNNREKIPAKYKWDLTVIYQTEADWEKDAKLLKEELYPKIAGLKGKLDNKQNILTCLKTCNEVDNVLYKMYWYAYLYQDINLNDPSAQKLYGRAVLLWQEAEVITAFIDPELAGKSDTVLKGYLNDPDLAEYKSKIQHVLINKPNISAEKSSILALATALTTSPSDTYSKLTNTDIRNAGLAYSNLGNTFAALLNAEVNKNIFLARADNQNSAIEASLNKKNVPISVYENLITSADKGLEAMHKFQRFSTVNQKGISYEKAQEMVLNSLNPLGEDYLTLIETAFNENWIDVYPAPNKCDHAYCSGLVGSHPFVLINYRDTFRCVSTLAHELGHAAHAYYSNDSHPTIFTAEVASTLNEILLCKYMIENAQTDSEKIVPMNRLLTLYSDTFFLQVMFAEFEKLIHEQVEAGNTLTLETLNNLYSDLVRKYYGYDIAPSDANGWMEIHHFYYNFYVFQYATGVVAANQLAFEISENKQGARETYLEFLQSGGRYDSFTTLLNTGVDMTSPKVMDDFIEEYVSLVNEMEQLLNRQQTVKIICIFLLPANVLMIIIMMSLSHIQKRKLFAQTATQNDSKTNYANTQTHNHAITPKEGLFELVYRGKKHGR